MYINLKCKAFKQEEGEDVVDLATVEKDEEKTELEHYEDLLGF